MNAISLITPIASLPFGIYDAVKGGTQIAKGRIIAGLARTSASISDLSHQSFSIVATIKPTLTTATKVLGAASAAFGFLAAGVEIALCIKHARDYKNAEHPALKQRAWSQSLGSALTAVAALISAIASTCLVIGTGGIAVPILFGVGIALSIGIFAYDQWEERKLRKASEF